MTIAVNVHKTIRDMSISTPLLFKRMVFAVDQYGFWRTINGEADDIAEIRRRIKINSVTIDFDRLCSEVGVLTQVFLFRREDKQPRCITAGLAPLRPEQCNIPFPA